MSTKLTQKITSVVLSVATVAWLVGTSFVPVARAQTVTIESLLQQIALLQAQLLALQSGSAPVAGSCSFTRSLTIGVKGDDVKCLQDYLTSTGHFTFSGGSTGTFGPITRTAVAAWQSANGVSPAVGYFGPISRAKYNALAASTGTGTGIGTGTGTTPPSVVPGTGIAVVGSAQQPTAGLHPDNAVRVPYTCLDFTASNDGDVTVDSITVERRGASTDATFSGVVLVDDRDVQIGVAKTLNSNHQATLSEDFKVAKGVTKKMCVAGNRTTTGFNGTTASFAVVAVAAKGGAAVSGTFPITGTTHTINTGLVIGTATVETGPAKSIATTTEDIGKHVVFTATKVSAGSTEDIRIKFFRWNQVGTAGSGDIANIKVTIDSTEYPVTVSTDGKYYTADFYPGVIVTKGNSAEVKIEGDLLRSNRTYQFDIQKSTDMGFRGELYGYGMNPTNSTGFTTTEPVYWSSNFTTRKGGTLNVEKDSAVPSTNIAVNVGDQPLGGFTVDVKGEPISVGSLVFRVGPTNVANGSTETAADITQIKIVKSDGTILAGPVDGTDAGTATFSDTITFPLGKTSIKLVGKLGTAFDSNDTISASTTPGTNWTTVTGDDSNETIVPTPASAVTSNVMTIKAGALTISVSAIPGAQTVVAGVNQFLFTTYQFDATQSGEDVRFTTIPLNYSTENGTASSLTSCQLYKGVNSITSGSNVFNPSAAGSSSFTFDGAGFVIPKGTTQNLDLKCNIAGGATGVYYWGIASTASFSPVGLTSGQTISPTVNTAPGSKMTLSSGGSYTVTNNSTPGYRIINSGSTGVTLLRLRIAAFDEDISLQRLAFNLGTGASQSLSGVASNTPTNLVNSQVNIYDEANPTALLGTAQFTNNGDYATSSLLLIPASGTSPSSNLIVPKGGVKDIVVKGDIAAIGVGGNDNSRSGDLLTVNYDGQALGINGGNYGTGQSSGTNIAATTNTDTEVGGVRIMRAYPEFAFIDLSTSQKVLTTNSSYILYRYSVKAVGGDVHLAKMTFNISSTTISGNNNGVHATTSRYALYVYTDPGFSLADPLVAGATAGLVNNGQCYNNNNAQGQDGTGANGAVVAGTDGLAGDVDIEIWPTSTCLTGTTTYKVPANATRYFELRAAVDNVETSTGVDTILVTLRGDAAFPTTHQNPRLFSSSSGFVGDMGNSGVPTTTPWGTNSTNPTNNAALKYGVDADTNNDFIWSPGSTSTSPTISDFDFTNGFQLPGLPGNDMPIVTHTSAN